MLQCEHTRDSGAPVLLLCVGSHKRTDVRHCLCKWVFVWASDFWRYFWRPPSWCVCLASESSVATATCCASLVARCPPPCTCRHWNRSSICCASNVCCLCASDVQRRCWALHILFVCIVLGLSITNHFLRAGLDGFWQHISHDSHQKHVSYSDDDWRRSWRKDNLCVRHRAIAHAVREISWNPNCHISLYISTLLLSTYTNPFANNYTFRQREVSG